MAGFKLFVFDREAHFIGPQESGCSTIGRSQKAVWILAQIRAVDQGKGSHQQAQPLPEVRVFYLAYLQKLLFAL